MPGHTFPARLHYTDNWDGNKLTTSPSDDDYGFTPEATINVDNLVSDDQSDEITAYNILSPFGTPSRTTSVPPGLGFIAHGHPPRTSTPSRPPPGLVSQQSTPGPSVVPIAIPMTPLKTALAPTPAGVTGKKTPSLFTGSEAKKNIKAFAVESGLSKEITSQSKASTKSKKAVLQDEDFPALEASKPISRTSTPVPTKAPSIKTPMVIKRAQTETPKSVATPVAFETPTETPSTQKSKKAEKKPMPVLNIAAATKAAAAAAAKKSSPSSATTSAVEKPDDTAFPALPTAGSMSVSSPVTRGPKTLRVISTPKTETSPSIFASTSGPPSLRHALSGLQRPETPGSENVSDSASIVSASVSASRTNSPPPNSRIGSATVRTTTKSQQRKARKEATKKGAAAIATTSKPEPEIEIAPILGRKKKQKKDKPTLSKEATPTTESRPPSPGPADMVGEKEIKASVGTSTYRQAVNESISLLEGTPALRSRRKDGNYSTGEASKPVVDRAVPSPAAVLHEILKGGLISDPEAVALLKAISSTTHRSDQYTTVFPKDGLPELKAMITKEDQQALLAGKPVRKVLDGSRVMLTPNGNCVRNLTPAEEERYLQLQADLAVKFDDATTYVHPRHEAANGFSVIRGRAVPNGTPPYFPQGPVAAIASVNEHALPVVDDPMLKMNREEALANINQAVMTRFNLGTMNVNSIVEGQHAGDFHVDATGAANPLSQIDAASRNVIKTLEPFFSSLAAASSNSHSTLDVAAGNDSFNGLAQTMPPPPPLPTTPTSATAAGKTIAASIVKGGALAGITAMTLDEMENAFQLAKKEAEKVEKSLNQVIKKNRRLLSLSASGAGAGH